MWAAGSEAKVLYVQTHGTADPGRSATPFFLAAAAAVVSPMSAVAIPADTAGVNSSDRVSSLVSP